MASCLIWFESDLRLVDHAALTSAVESGRTLLPVFVWNGGAGYATGGASRWWLYHSLLALSKSLSARGLPLILRSGPAERVLPEIAAEVGADAVYWHHRVDPLRRARDARITTALRAAGVEPVVFAGEIVHDPDHVRTKAGGPYQVFTPFHRRLTELVRIEPPLPIPDIGHDRSPAVVPSSEPLESLGLLPKFDWAAGLRSDWAPGEDAAQERLRHFVAGPADRYVEDRDRPDRDGTARLSPHLHFGEVSARQVMHLAQAHAAFTRQIAWREFAHHLLHHFPHTPHEPLRKGWERFPWAEDPDGLSRWQQGQTGYPIVDAGMRQLWHTGWMHNRVRMIVGSFLTKDLLLPWQAGAAWFEDTLVDMDVANNTLGWQWTAGCGADAQPFFRIFNPVSQGKRFDPDGAYVRTWIPELSGVPGRHLHTPWEAASGLRGGYPDPIVDHDTARRRALDAYAVIRG